MSPSHGLYVPRVTILTDKELAEVPTNDVHSLTGAIPRLLGSF